MSKRKKNLNEYCNGCLTTDRPLVSIDSHFYIFLKLMVGEIYNIRKQKRIPKMCWECRASLRNSEKFMQKVRKAYEFLNGKSKKMVKVESLSNLKTVFINYYDLQEIHEEFEPDLKPTDVPRQIEVSIELKELKEENLSSDEKVETEYDNDAYEDIKEESIKIEEHTVEEPLIPQTQSNDYEVEIKEQQKKREIKSMKSKYKVIYLDKHEIETCRAFKRVQIDDNERIFWMEKDKNARNYSCMPYKCELCVTGYPKKVYYDRHVTNFHLKSSGKFICDMCQKRYKERRQFVYHIREHYVKYVCLLCKYENYRLWKIKSHFTTHNRAVMCLTCGLKFEKHHDFYEHYRRLHQKVICDYCGKRWTKKHRLIKHIRIRHSKHSCDVCNRTYMSFDALVNHVRLNHEVSRTEESYCVECNIQFDNISRYTLHLKNSVKHKTYVGVPCPVCNKVYHKKYSMNNHYRYVHLKKTPYYCEKCSRYFLNSYRLRLHKERIHDKIPAARDRMCPHCGRGFSTNRILINHIRTHTGERPFVCDICSAKFTQRTALVTHQRSIHKIKK